jgi:O-Antigen ligase
MRRTATTGAVAVLLAGPIVLGFFSGGYFDGPREWAGGVAWVLVAIAMLAVPRPLPRSRGGWLTLGGLAAFAVWTLISFTWASVAGEAYHAGQRVFLYLGVLLAAVALLRERWALRAVEPAFAGGTLILIGYALAGRFLPGVLHYSHSISAQGRLEQPLTYWNALGEVAAIGLVLCVRIAGDPSRVKGLRVAAAAASAPLGMGLYLTFSRGALFACLAGLVALAALAPTRAQIRALVGCLAAAVLAAVAVAPMHHLATLSGSGVSQERQGAIAFALLALIMAVAAAVQWRRGDAEGMLRLPRGAPWIALGVICAGLAVAIVLGAHESSASPSLRPGAASRYTTFNSSRYSYWNVAFRAFDDQPLHGVGAENWAVYWLRDRPIVDFAQDAHSLELQTLAELGVIGVLILLTFLGGAALASYDAHRLAPKLAAGPIAGFVVYVAHSPLDWDWQMPAVTVIAMILAGAIVAVAESATASRGISLQRASAMIGASRRKTTTATTQTST